MNEEERPSAAAEERASDFDRVERASAETMAQRPQLLDEAGRAITDPGQDARAPEEQASVRQAGLPPDEQHLGPTETSR